MRAKVYRADYGAKEKKSYGIFIPDGCVKYGYFEGLETAVFDYQEHAQYIADCINKWVEDND